MQSLLNPRWILIINTVPIIILYILFFGQFAIIKSLLESEHITYWKIFGSTLFILGFLNLLYALFLIIKKRKVSIFYAILALLLYIPFIYIYSQYSEEIIPFSIPQWMVSSNIILYVGTFLMPTLAYSLFIIVVHFTPKNKKHNALVNFFAAIAVPIFWYLFFQVIFPLWKPVDSNFGIHTLLIFLITGTLLFLFFVIRGVFILVTKKETIWKKHELAWKIPIAILFPLLGLAINNGHLTNNYTIDSSGIFGDFNNHWFYILAVINGTLMCLPNRPNLRYQIVLFIGRNITFAYSLYFFIVFLPFLPLSVIAIIAIGTGFLMLTPLLLFVIHIQELIENFVSLKNYFSTSILRTISILSFLVIPMCLTIQYKSDQNTLKDALNYVYNPNYSKQYLIDKSSLKKTMNTVKQHKEKRNGGFLNGYQTPYLSSFYNWIVLGNLTLSNAKIDMIEHIFYGTPSPELLPEKIRNDNVNISNITSQSVFDPSQNVWKSWINLEITNNDSTNGLKEYATTFTLPNGCWISDYYLYVGDRKEMGLLAEKKSAMWVFSQIRNENKDPGLLYYLTGNKVAFRVFPFAKNETRKTGIEFLHKDPVILNIDGKEIELGQKEEEYNSQTVVENNTMIYVSSKEKEKLKKIRRQPYFHFLVDISLQKDTYINEFSNRIKKLIAKNKEYAKKAQISFVNTYVSSYTIHDDWQTKYKNKSFEGGFYLDRGIKKVLYDSYQNDTNSYPILVVVTDTIENSVLHKDFADFKITFPENNEFYTLSKRGVLQAHSLLKNPKKQIIDTVQKRFNKEVLAYKYNNNNIAYLPNDNEPNIIIKKGIQKITEDQILEKNWNQALLMQGMWMTQTLFPENSKKEWLNLVKHSFISKVMSPVTSYLVVENEAQKAILKKKQEQVLTGNKDLDLGEDTPRMSEPNIIIILLLFIGFLWYRKKRKNQKVLVS